MNIQTHSFKTYAVAKEMLQPIKAVFDELAIWDSKTGSIDSGSLSYNYGKYTLEFIYTDNKINVELSFGTYSHVVQGTSSSNTFTSITVCQTNSTTAFIIASNVNQSAPPPSKVNGNNVLAFALTTNHNTTTDADEKGIVIAGCASSTTSGFYILLSSEESDNENKNTFDYNDESASTSLVGACCKTYSGYCEHVFLPVIQNVARTSCKCIIQGTRYYIMCGALYVLDD